uniref:Gamma-butyrobetaine hydroxylase-like N-terminal domain-containing protein n=1 Tax=Eucampia antarctica TaxID=49252 RepID=A0A7S2R3J3_9STRA
MDILLLDLPPGTGDVQMTICQELELSGAVAVTTPSKLAITDARKGIDMFRSMGVSTLAAVENMSYFTCEGGGKHYPFGKGIGGDSSTFLKEEVGLKSSNIFQLPISEFTNTSNDEGSPLCCSRPADAASEIFVFSKLAKTVATELILLRNGKGDMEKQATVVTLVDESHKNRYDVASLQLVLNKEGKTFTVRLFSESGATQLSINGEDLRLRHPKTGEMLENEDISTDIENATCSSSSNQIIVQQHQHKQPKFIPMKVDKKGRYGYEIEFSDGATIIYSMLSIAIAAGGKVKEDNL